MPRFEDAVTEMVGCSRRRCRVLATRAVRWTGLLTTAGMLPRPSPMQLQVAGNRPRVLGIRPSHQSPRRPRDVLDVSPRDARLLRRRDCRGRTGHRGWHWGQPTRAALGARVNETLVHTYDSPGSRCGWRPPKGSAAAVLAGSFLMRHPATRPLCCCGQPGGPRWPPSTVTNGSAGPR